MSKGIQVYFYRATIIILVVLLTIMLIVTTVLNSATGALIKLMGGQAGGTEYVQGMRQAVAAQHFAIVEYIYMDTYKGVATFERNDRVFLDNSNLAYTMLETDLQRTSYNNIMESYMAMVYRFNQLRLSNMDRVLLREMYTSTIAPVVKDLEGELAHLAELHQSQAVRSSSKMAETMRKYAAATTLVFLSACLGFILFALRINASYVRPIKQLCTTIQALREGKEVPVQFSGSGELEEIHRGITALSAQLRGTERKTRSLLEDMQNKTDTIAKSIPDPMIILDADYQVVLVNAAFCRLVNLQEDKVLGSHFLEVIASSILFPHIQHIDYKTTEYKQVNIPLTVENSPMFYQIKLTPILHGDNHDGIIIAFYDITNLKQLEELRTSFTATISHEIKTPLTSIIMGVSLLANPPIGPLNSEQQEILNTIAEDGEQLNALVTNLLELSKAESAKSVYNVSQNNIAKIIETSCKQFYALASKQGTKLTSRSGEDLPLISCDFHKIVWVLNNLISNALKFTGEGDEITVEASLLSQSVRFSVSDTGAGIAAEALRHIFDRYVHFDWNEHTVPNTGLGLSIAREIVQAHNGKLWCESTLGKGSTFYFLLPL